ncbi:hypothetical protein J2755_001325 [Methanohalophilus levihalophilus]|uniref:hypothetical protein n=1 Tax=Methanohalophilus levihalophilus TaxID=1431282 RepID=UPI001AE73BDB|nr:hypothetical protein [Methanohalophilus levihalophilus]MBP2030391.1 hypothetical protein [Methanohalophilus levihalophilus]
MDSSRGLKMKIRLEVFDDDDREIATVRLEGSDWEQKLIQFIEMFGDTQPPSAESSSQPIQPNIQQNQPQVSPQPAPQMYYQVPPQQYYPMYWPQFPPQYAPQQIPLSVPPTTTQEQIGKQTAVERSGRSARPEATGAPLTISERLELFLKYEFPRMWATSQDIQQHYETVYGPIKLSTVSTYLSRMFHKNLVDRRGNRNRREYLFVGDEISETHADRQPHSYLHRV